MVPSCLSRAHPCLVRSCWADNFRRVVGDAFRALILYDAATRSRETYLLRCARVFLFHAAPHRESLQVSRGHSRGREKDVACRENVSARGTFRVKCPLVHLQPPPPKNHPRDVQSSFVGYNGTCGGCAAWGTLIPQNGNSSRMYTACEAYLKNTFFYPLIYLQTVNFVLHGKL